MVTSFETTCTHISILLCIGGQGIVAEHLTGVPSGRHAEGSRDRRHIVIARDPETHLTSQDNLTLERTSLLSKVSVGRNRVHRMIIVSPSGTSSGVLPGP
jgi:hypothetical protein